MASVARRSPRPASGSSANASAASVRSPDSAASTVSSCTATWRRTISSKGAGSARAVTAADAVAVDDADRLDHHLGRAGRRPGPSLGMLTGASNGSPVSIASITGRGQLAGLPGLQVLGAGQPGVDVGDVAGLVLLALGDRGQLDVVVRPPARLGREHRRDELGDVAVTGRGKAPQRSSSVSLSRWRCGEVQLGEGLGLGPARGTGPAPRAPDLLDQARARSSKPSSPSTSSAVTTGKWLTPATVGRDRLGGAAQGDGQVHAPVARPRGTGRPS